MKISLLYLLLLLVSLNGSGQNNQKYTIKGTLPDNTLDGSYVTLTKVGLMFEKEKVKIDSVKVKNGKFTLKGKAEKEPFLASLGSAKKNIGNLIIEPGKINVVKSSPEFSANVSGTPINEAYNRDIIIPFKAYLQADSLRFKKEKAMANGSWTVDDELHYRNTMPKELLQVFIDKKWNFVENHLQYPEVVIFDVYLYYSGQQTGRIEKILSQLPEKTVTKIYATKDSMDRHLAEFMKKNSISKFTPKEVIPEAVQVGKTFSDFKGTTVDGKPVTLSETVKNNKLVLIDFWASWCAPCLKEMPVIIDIYKQYKDKGLEILGISSDASSQRWKDAIKKNKMTPQIMSGREDRIGKTYAVKMIPYTILIDQSGKIVARNLRGEELTRKIKELLETIPEKKME